MCSMNSSTDGTFKMEFITIVSPGFNINNPDISEEKWRTRFDIFFPFFSHNFPSPSSSISSNVLNNSSM